MKTEGTKAWDKKNTKRYSIQVMLKTEADIYKKLESVESKATYIKDLIRKDIEREA